MTRLHAALEGDLKKIMADEVKSAARAITRAVSRAASGLQRDLRTQVRRAGLGRGVEKAWSTIRYPKGKASMSASALIYSKSPRIHAAFTADTIIRARGGRWLVIPLEAAIARGWHLDQRRSAGSRPRRWANVDAAVRALGQLNFAPLPNGKALLVHREGREDVPYFLLVRSVSLKKRLDFEEPAGKWADRLPQLIVTEMGRT